MAKHLVLVGGGHAHLTCLKMLKNIVDQGHRVTLISPAEYHYYSGMGPGMLAGTYSPQEIRFNVRRMAESAGGEFVLGTVVRIDCQSRVLDLATGQKIEFDVVSLNTGSSIPMDTVRVVSQENVFPVKPIDNLLKAQKLILSLLGSEKLRILVVGGGPAGLELAGNAWRLVHNHGGASRITLLAGKRLMTNFPDKVRHLALKSLLARQIEVIEGVHLSTLESGYALLDEGRQIPFDVALLALGVKPASLFSDSGMATGSDGGMLVNKYLHAVDHPGIFGGGDCISFQDRPLDKVGVYAVRQNPILYHNLLASLNGQNLIPFHPQSDYLLIFNLGDGRGIFRRRNWVWNGRLAFYLKDYIDRKFMKKFQISGEQQEK
ncbi:MAG: NAD(P)/FAD-dependent oxidoreductase [Thermodesulfobacteriota bacterium]